MPRTKHSISLGLPQPTVDWLKAEAARRGMSPSALATLFFEQERTSETLARVERVERRLAALENQRDSDPLFVINSPHACPLGVR